MLAWPPISWEPSSALPAWANAPFGSYFPEKRPVGLARNPAYTSHSRRQSHDEGAERDEK
jgi:hypothetical protein